MALKFNIIQGIPVAKRAQARDAIFRYLPNNETEPDPAWVDPEDGTPPDQIPKYTDVEWADEIVWRWLKRCYNKGELLLANDAAEKLTDIRN